MDTRNKIVLITGVTSGIGKALAQEFAKNEFDIIGVSQHQQDLDQVEKLITSTYQQKVYTISQDLTTEDGASIIYEEVKKMGMEIDILVNDAGVGQRGYFNDIPIEKYEELIRLNILALTRMTKLFINDMIERDYGKILQLGSIAGFEPGPLMAVYHATKAYVVSFSEALITELEDMDSNVSITCLCPGPTDTNFFSRGDLEDTNVVEHKDQFMASAEEVAKGGYKALMDNERIYIPGAKNNVTTFIRRVIPKSTQSKLQMKFYEHSSE
ncbi:hypothetical protein APR41_10450 [Salegentibacter salinarum]|uniref:Short-chain dehydrogenase n=1 Tax=Salegentibacter salinarum TaxID=447422 RepID=A0A2N0TNC8_9FLAO|nr:SDR family oxidoreductase [Salegentibacter salinarum]PKD16198.1 hypothetical protein APR41_10450 [Salegentibacter salinarum]SKB68020.1 hypothetical protein SAMN05660903_02014 [Salegentibacter salinarum]